MNGLEKKLTRIILTSHPLFAHLPPSTLDELILLFKVENYKKDEVIVRENDFIDKIFFVAHGKAEVQAQGVPVALLHKSEAIGLTETGFYSPSGKRTATVIAATDVTLLSIDISALDTFAKEWKTESTILLRMNFIKKILPFSEISQENLYKLAETVIEKTIPAGTLVFQQGDQTDYCYLLYSGKLEVFLENSDGSQKKLAELIPPAIFGEAGLLMQTERNATVCAIEESKLFLISGEQLLAVVETEKTAAEAFISMMSFRSRPVRYDLVEVYKQKDKVTLKNPSQGKYFRLTKEGYFVWQKLDGKHSIRDIVMELFLQCEVFNPRLVSSLIARLDAEGFIEIYPGKQQKNLIRLPLWIKVLTKLRSIMEAKYAFKNADTWLTKSYQSGIKFLFHPLIQVFFVTISLLGLAVFFVNFNQNELILREFPAAKWLLIAVIPFVMLVFIFHELAHAYTTKLFKRKVFSFGVGWLWLGPIAFCDTSDMWLNPRWQRILVDVAGIYVGFIAAGLAGILSLWVTSPFLLLGLWYFSLLNYLLIFVNLSPIIDLDGYYLLIDSLNQPNLRENAITSLTTKQHMTGSELSYWIICLIYLASSFFISYLILNTFLTSWFGLSNPMFSLLLSLLVLLFSGASIWSDVRRKQLEQKV